MLAESLPIKRELYVAFLLDRTAGGTVCMTSVEGGVDIEKLAEESPEKIFKDQIHKEFSFEQAVAIAKRLGFEGELLKQTAAQLQKLHTLFVESDALQVEINPFVETSCGKVVSFDAKIEFDENADFRQSFIGFETRTPEGEEALVAEAKKFDLSYIPMEGNIGCLVNGAGLAMATMDIVKLFKGQPANFLDVGGNTTESKIMKSMEIITSDPRVKVIFINIFGGIVQCDIIAKGFLSAFSSIKGWNWPTVIRLSGTNSEKGIQLLRDKKLSIFVTSDFEKAAMKAVELSK